MGKTGTIALSFILLLCASCAERQSHEGFQFLTELDVNVPPFYLEDGSKTSCTMDDGGVNFSWVRNDLLGFIPGKVKTGDERRQMIFYVQDPPCFKANGWGLIPGDTYYAYYPYDASNSASSLTIDYTGQTQKGNAGMSHIGRYDYLHSRYDVPKGVAGSLEFKHLGCLAIFNLKIASQFLGNTFTSLTLESKEDVFVQSLEYNPLDDDAGVLSKTMGSSLKIGLKNASPKNGILTVYAMMSPTAWQSEKITAILETGRGVQCSGTFSPTAVMQPGRAYSYSPEINIKGETVNLTASGSSNCFIVSEQGKYHFLAARSGQDEAVQGIKGVKLLWKTDNTARTSALPSSDVVDESSVSYGNGRIRFATGTTFKEGNAVIAAYDDEACSDGHILWSWHIWCTDEPADEEYSNNAGYLMDRNLGALSRDGNLSGGLLYQWGRKDPFPGSSNISGPFAGMTLWKGGEAVSMSSVSSSGTAGTVDYAVKHPLTFIKKTDSTNLDWIYTKSCSDRKWCDTEGNKTVYDPCPAGYKVITGSTTSSRGFWATAAGDDFRLAVNTQNSMLSFPLVSGNALYPLAGCMNEQGEPGYTGSYAFVWADCPYGWNRSSWAEDYAGNLNYDPSQGGFVEFNYNSGRAAGKNVRCMKMAGSGTVAGPVVSDSVEGYGTPIHSGW